MEDLAEIFIATARVRSTTGGYVFSLFTPGRGGIPSPSHNTSTGPSPGWGGYTSSRGVPQFWPGRDSQDGVTPGQVSMGYSLAGMEYSPGQGWVIPLARDGVTPGQGWVTTPPSPGRLRLDGSCRGLYASCFVLFCLVFEKWNEIRSNDHGSLSKSDIAFR